MKNIGFLSFGHWTPSPQSQTRSAADTLLQSIELAVAAEELRADGYENPFYWPRMPEPPTSSPAGVCSWASAAAHPSR
jgi:hypothetical protein